MATAKSPAELVTDELALYLGPHTARVAVKTFSQRELGRAPETLTYADLSALLDALRPMLKTMLGTARAEAILRNLAREAAR